MTVAIDATSASQSWEVAYNTVKSWNHTCAGSNPALYVILCVSVEAGATQIASVDYNGTPLTLKVRDTMNNGTGFRFRSEIWELLNPTTGVSQAINVVGSATEYISGYASSISLTGVLSSDGGVTRGSTSASTSGTLSSAVTTAVGNMVLAAFTGSETSPTAGNTNIATDYNTTYLFSGIRERQTPAGTSESMTATQSVSGVWAGCGLNINASGGGGGAGKVTPEAMMLSPFSFGLGRN